MALRRERVEFDVPRRGVFAMGLRATGIDIVTLALALTLGLVAVEVVLSFGLRGRETPGRRMEHRLRRFRGD